jgi:hypothetical protein
MRFLIVIIDFGLVDAEYPTLPDPPRIHFDNFKDLVIRCACQSHNIELFVELFGLSFWARGGRVRRRGDFFD